MRLFVGQSSFRGAISRYAARFDIVEVTADIGRIPRKSGLAAWRAAVPPEFAFSVAVASSVASLETSAAAVERLDYAEQVANVLGAPWLLVKTPASVTPGSASQRKLAALFERLSGSGRRVAWEPRGVWADAEPETFAAEHGVALVRDGTRETLPETDVVYTRLRALGASASVSLGSAELLAEQLQDREEAVVIIEGQGALRVRQTLKEVLEDDEDEDETEEPE